MHIEDLTGQSFNHLTVLSFYQRTPNQTLWICKCTCYNFHIVASKNLGKHIGGVKSCGHLRKKHGVEDNNFQNIWCSFNQRCYCPTDKGYKNYGGRGIFVCAAWKRGQKNNAGLVNFTEWCKTNSRPSSKYSLDRIDNDGPYSPSNCRWATSSEQNKNRRTTQDLEKYRMFIKLKNLEHEFVDFINSTKL